MAAGTDSGCPADYLLRAEYADRNRERAGESEAEQRQSHRPPPLPVDPGGEQQAGAYAKQASCHRHGYQHGH